MDATELELFGRSVGQAIERHTGEDLDAALAQLGWADALVEDPYTSVAVLFPRQGAANATSGALDQVLATGLGLPATEAVVVVLPPLGTRDAPGARRDGRFSIRGLSTATVHRAERAFVATTETTVVEVPTATLARRPVMGIDPDLGLLDVTTDGVAEGVAEASSEARWDAAVVLAQLALGYEIVGAARTMLALAREHALDRIQYGRPIAQFQAVRHRLADALVAIESAEAVLVAAREARSPELVRAGKALAGRGGRTAARHCQQVLAGIGFTGEHPFHRYYRRVLVLDQLFGSARALSAALGDRLVRSGEFPSLLPL